METRFPSISEIRKLIAENKKINLQTIVEVLRFEVPYKPQHWNKPGEDLGTYFSFSSHWRNGEDVKSEWFEVILGTSNVWFYLDTGGDLEIEKFKDNPVFRITTYCHIPIKQEKVKKARKSKATKLEKCAVKQISWIRAKDSKYDIGVGKEKVKNPHFGSWGLIKQMEKKDLIALLYEIVEDSNFYYFVYCKNDKSQLFKSIEEFENQENMYFLCDFAIRIVQI